MDSQTAHGQQDHEAALDLAIQDHQAGRLAAAEAAYRRILGENPRQPDALHLLGMLACDHGDAETALRLIEAALAIAPARAAFHNTRARALKELSRLPEAEVAYRTAWSLWSESPEIANNLGCLLREKGDIDGAMQWFCRARDMAPQSGQIACNLADALAATGAQADSVALFRHALSLQPDSADTRYRFGQVLLSLGCLDEAERQYRSAIGLRPGHAASHNNLGLVLQAQGQDEAAKRCFQEALCCDARCADALYNLGCLLLLDGQQDSARDCHDAAIAADPLHGAALWARCTVELPVLYETAAQIPQQRTRYAEQLAQLAAKADNPSVAHALAKAVGASQPFFLPYQGCCDRDLQTLYGKLVARVLQAEPVRQAGPPARGEPIRLGIVSGYFREHTLWHLMLKGWLSQLDPSLLQLHAYHTGSAQDAQTALARRLCPQFISGGVADIRAAILRDSPHVLLYPELGIDPAAMRLAGERLAPLQCVAWGHPETSGLPTIDVFLSSELMEPAEAQSHYTERLVPLPNLGIHYVPDEQQTEPCSRADLGFREDAVVFWCGQALYKYSPRFDDVFPRIAAAVGDCQFLFIGFAKSRTVTAQFRARLQRAFKETGLDAGGHCVFLDPMPQGRFLGTVRMADVVLDTIGWSGGKSTLDTLAETPVIVTHRGPLMRGRHTAAILTRIGVTDTIAATVDEYVAIAVRLARDPSARMAIRARMAAGRHHAIADTVPIRALEAFLAAAVRQ